MVIVGYTQASAHHVRIWRQSLVDYGLYAFQHTYFRNTHEILPVSSNEYSVASTAMPHASMR